MNETLTYIEHYFTGQLSATEKEAFEDQCVADPVFAEEVAFYVSMRNGLKQQLYEQKKKEFDELHAQLSHHEKPVRSILVRMIPYAAAACILLVLGWVLFFKAPSPQTIANQYIDQHLKTLGITMSGNSSTDSLQMGIVAYNQKKFKQAEQIFYPLVQKPEAKAEALKNLGLVYLMTEQYDQALVQFETLAQLKLFANQGLFYQGLVLMKRSGPGDREKAKEIFQEVIQNNLPGNQEARIWIKNL